MVRKLIHLSLLTLMTGLFPVSKAAARDLADYHVGDTVESNIVATERMVVTDPEATEALKEKEANKLPIICRFYPSAADEAETALHKAFVSARQTFLSSVETAFKKKTLDAPTTDTDEFRHLVGGFQSRNTGFPLNTELAARWARGESDGGLEDSLTARLQEAMTRPIRPYGMPEGLTLTYNVRLVSLPTGETTPTLDAVEHDSRIVVRTNLITLRWQRSKLKDSFGDDEQAWGTFLAGFLKENCFPDAELTRRFRDQQTAQLQVADTYEPGQTIARKGDVVDRKVMAAISQMKLTASRLEQRTAAQQTKIAVAQERERWLIGALAGVCLIVVVLIWLFGRQRPAVMLPARTGEGGEAMGQASEMRERLAPHLARLMMNKLVGGLISQRKEMIATQEKAAADLAAFEAHLEKIRAPLEERLRAYEQRITELEKELAARGEENQELLKAKILMIRKQMESTRSKGKLELN